MQDWPIGYLLGVSYIGVCTMFALAPPRPARSSRSHYTFWLGYLINELPILAALMLVASTWMAFNQGDIFSLGGWIGFSLAALTALGLITLARRGFRARDVLQDAIRKPEDANGIAVDDGSSPSVWSHLQSLLFPFLFFRRDVERIRNISYGESGKHNLLDLYRPRDVPAGAPTLIYLHGGGFRSGGKSREALPMIYRLASEGWICISANYRLRPKARFPENLIDIKRAIAWVRAHGHEYGADPSVMVMAGSSAGGHLASTAGLTANDPRFQPGFEQADTSVSGVISLYGYYGAAASRVRLPSSPQDYVRKDAPPFFVAHGDLDTIVLVEDARRFVESVRSRSNNPVVYAELPGAQHSFDLFRSPRFAAVIDAVQQFADWIWTRRDEQEAAVLRT